MRPALRLLAVDALRTLLTRRASALLLVLLFGLLTAVSCSLQLAGESVVNGQVVPIDNETRSGLAVGVAYGGVHFLGLLLVLFVIVPAITGEMESGVASWIFVKPIGRETYLIARMLGGLLFLAAFSAFVVAGLEVLLLKYSGRFEARAILGWVTLLILLASYLGWGVLLSLHLGAGFGGLLVLLLAGLGAAVNLDPLTRILLWGGGSGAPAGILDAFLAPLFGAEGPPFLARAVYAALYFVLPGAGNVHDLAVGATFGRGLPIQGDAISLAIPVAGIPLALLLSLWLLKKREF